MRRTVTAVVYNQAGVLSRITSTLNRRQVNIESISVGTVERKDISRMTISFNVETEKQAQQVIKQLNKQIEVLKVTDLTHTPHVERELALIKVNAPANQRLEIQAMVSPFRANIVDVAAQTITIQVVGHPDKVEACIELLKPYGIKRMARTGVTSLIRG